MKRWLLMFFLTSILSFLIVRSIPVSPVNIYLEKYQLPSTKENIEIVEKKFGLDKPLYIQYIDWMYKFLKGNLGKSYLSNIDLNKEYMKRLPYSISIGVGGIVLSGIFAFFLGYLSSRNILFDKFTRMLSVISQTIPVFVLSIFLIYVISIKFKISIFSKNINIKIILGIITVAFYHIGQLSRIATDSFNRLKSKTYVKFYSFYKEPKMYGYNEVIYDLLSAILSKFTFVIGGTATVEFVYTIPGISYFLIDSILQRDYIVIQSYIMIVFVWMFFIHLIFNLLIYIFCRGNVK